MGTIIIGGILVIAILAALYSAIKHFRGEGSCCQGGCSGCSTKSVKKFCKRK